jgi:UDP-N-acetylglucosamine--N-acetylmuramyl-(pentapeptide) pyrophosphoryl-undecaprenol N-acetylglucosamine transferase
LRVVFAGGGTGGHLYPAIAVADALRDRFAAGVTFIGAADRLEATIVPKAGYRLEAIASRPLVRKFSLEFFRTLVANAAGTWQSLSLLSRLRPDVVIATGGYVCFPVVLAARFLRQLRLSRAPIVLVELNALPGLTNRLLAPLVDEVWGTFDVADAGPRFAGKHLRTGIPVRGRLRALPPRADAIARFGLDPQRQTLLAMGGSQGARRINDAVTAVVENGALPAGWQLVLVTGADDHARVRSNLQRRGVVVRAYLDDISDGYAAADVILARAGASTLGELAAVGKPAILVPYPFAAGDHQTANARRFAESGAAVVIADAGLDGPFLGATLVETLAPVRLGSLRAAAERLRGSGDPIATIIARVERLTARKNQP